MSNVARKLVPTLLTAIAPPKYQLGQSAAEILLRRMRSGPFIPLEQIQLRPPLVIRESCGSRNRSS